MSAPVTFYPNVTEGTRYWRCEVPGRKLGAKIANPQAVLHVNRGISVESVGQEGEVAVWQHVGEPLSLAAVAHQVMQGVRVYIDVDDNYLMRPGKNVPDVWTEENYACHREALEIAHGVLCSSQVLTNVYAKHLHGLTPVHYCPNAIDPDDYPPRHIAKHEGDPFRVGFAGSTSHLADLRILRQALKWASKQDGVQVTMLGITQHTSFDFDFLGIPGLPITDYRLALTNLDVGLAPLISDPWTRCKTDIKPMEYAMAGALPLVSRAEPFVFWWQRPPWLNGNSTAKEWMAMVRLAIEDREWTRKCADYAYHLVMERRQIKQEIFRWVEALEL